MFKVYYPHGGKMFMLIWWTHDKQNQMLLAKNEKAISATVLNHITENLDAKLNGYYEIEIVAPSEKLSNLHALRKHKDNVANFASNVAARLLECIEFNKEIPKQFELCQDYDPDHYDLEQQEELKSDEWSKKNHYLCMNCHNAIRIAGSDEEFYDRYKPAWNTIFPPYLGKDKPVDSAACRARDNETIWYAVTDHGIVLREIDMSSIKLEDDCLIHRPLFFYRLLNTLSVLNLQNILHQVKNTNKELKNLAYKEEQNKRKEESLKKLEKFLSIFKE